MIGSYHRLFEIEKSFRMSKSDLQARPVYHRTRDSIEAHLTIVFAALAVSRWIGAQTGWSIRKFVKTARRYRGGREALRAIGMERADRVDLFRDLLGGASAATAHPNGASRS